MIATTPLVESLSAPRPHDLSPEPILAAVEAYEGAIFDLDQSIVVRGSQLRRARRRLSADMTAAGLEPGDRVVMAIGNGPRFIAALAATLASGGSPLLLHGETPPEELRRTALRFGARFAITDGVDEQPLRGVSFAVTTLGDDWHWLRWARLSSRLAPSAPSDYLPAVPLHPTSGTTGHPKVAARPGPCAMAEAEHYIDTIGITADDLLLAAAPMSHAYAYGMCAMVPLLSGASVATMRRFSARAAHDAFEQLGVTIFPAVPAILDMLLFGGRPLGGRARCLLTAGSPLPPRTAQACRERYKIPLRPLYGTTETGGIAVAPGEGAPLTGEAVGPPMRGVGVDIRTDVAGLGNGLGIVHVRSSSMMAGYLDDNGLDTAWLDDGWFATGDLGTLDAAGNICLRGRQAEVINVGGLKILPREVEEVIAAMPAVRCVKVYAGRRASGSQFVKAAIVAEPGLELADVRGHCARHLVYYKRPDMIFFLDDLPKSPAGKVLCDRLP